MAKKVYNNMNLPYTFARVSAMKKKLIPKSEYHKMLKMDLTAITRYLQESNYKTAITKLSTKYSKVELVDQALKYNQEETFSKLIMISPPEVVRVINSYVLRIQIQNLKVVIRGIYSNTKKDEVLALIQPIGKYDEAYFSKLFDMNTVENILKNTKIIEFKDISTAFEEFRKTNRLIELENEFDKYYYNNAIMESEHLSGTGSIYRDFILREIDLLNIKNLMRLKKEKIESKTIEKHLIFEGKKLDKQKLLKMASADSYNSLINMLKTTPYEKNIAFDESISLTDMQLKIEQYLMKSAVLKVHQNPISIACVINYMLSKIIELRNIRSIVKSKHFGISEDYIENKLLI
jgi:V/A-type H+-transporting ATPase subunit C